MQLGDIYGAILVLVLAGILLGVGLTVLGKLASTDGVTATAAEKVNETVDALGNFPTWFVIFVVIIAAAIIITLVLQSFGRGMR